jgi:hypothetical protein
MIQQFILSQYPNGGIRINKVEDTFTIKNTPIQPGDLFIAFIKFQSQNGMDIFTIGTKPFKSELKAIQSLIKELYKEEMILKLANIYNEKSKQ